jgi:hypothetical protein
VLPGIEDKLRADGKFDRFGIAIIVEITPVAAGEIDGAK